MSKTIDLENKLNDTRSKGRINLPARASIWYIISGILGKACGIIATPFFTRILTDEEYGVLTLYMTVLGGASVICSAFSSGSAIYKGMQNFKTKNESFVKSALAVSLLFSTLVCLLLLTFYRFLGLKAWLLIPLSLQILCDSILGIFYSVDRFHYRYKEVCALSVISYVVPPAFAIFIWKRFGKIFGVRVLSLLGVSLICAIYALYKILHYKGKAKAEMMKYLSRHAMPLLPHSISSALSSQTDKVIITSLLGASALAKYSVAHSIGISLMFLVTTFGGALNPWIIRRLSHGESKNISALFTPLFSLLAAATLFPIAIAPEGMAILAPKEYSESLWAVMPIALSCLPSFVISTATVGMVHAEKGRYTVVLSLLTAGGCVLLNYMIIPSLGYMGAGLSVLLSQLIGAIASFYFLRLSGLDKMLKVRRISAIFLSTALTGTVISLLYPFPALRVLMLIFPAVRMLNSIFSAKHLIYEKSLLA